MCGRYYIDPDLTIEKVREIIDEAARRTSAAGEQLSFAGDLFPSQVVAVLADNRKLVPTPFAMRWGLPRADGGLLINTRSETAASKPLFKESAQRHRCLVPASGYYEWQAGEGGKKRYAIHPEADDACYLAGLFFPRPDTTIYPFTILTRAASNDIAFIHDRMPVVISEDDTAAWFDIGNDFDELLGRANTKMEYALG